MITLISILISNSYALPIQGKSIISRDSEQTMSIKTVKSSAEDKPKKSNNKKAFKENSNLPPEYSRRLTDFSVGEKGLYVSKNQANLNALKAGAIVRAIIDQELIISQNVPNPVRAVISSGAYSGNYLLGEAIFDKDLKRALINFTKILIKSSNESYTFKGQALSLKGSVGLEGEYFNQSAKFIIGEFASAALAGYLDSGISRTQTNQGNYVTEPSAANAAKTGAVAALSRSTERFAEASRSTSDYVKTNPFTEIQVVINEDASLQQ